jgi:invasion protein IalB
MARVLAPGGTHAERHGDWRWTCKQAQKASQCLQLVSIHPQGTIINHHEVGHP